MATTTTTLQIISTIPPKPKDIEFFKKKYEVKGGLQDGNYSTIRKGTDLTTGEQVAVKCVDKRKITKDDDDALRIEVSILNQLSHPNITRLYDWFEDPNNYYIVTEFMGGGELFDRIVKKHFYSEAEAQKVVHTIASTLKYLHDKKIVHRDLRPENILLQETKNDVAVKISDFGFARIVSEKGQTTLCGAPGYIAPEIISSIPYGISVDIWSFGVIIYILLCGYPPFYNESQKELFKLIREGNFTFDKPYWDSISNDAKGLIKAMLTVDVSQRLNIDGVMAHPWLLDKE
jgi:calcium/calmodulin-dependent protein kinase I